MFSDTKDKFRDDVDIFITRGKNYSFVVNVRVEPNPKKVFAKLTSEKFLKFLATDK